METYKSLPDLITSEVIVLAGIPLPEGVQLAPLLVDTYNPPPVATKTRGPSARILTAFRLINPVFDCTHVSPLSLEIYTPIPEFAL